MSVRMRNVMTGLGLVGAIALTQGASAAADAATKRAELRKMCDEALATLYKEKPEVKAAIAGQPPPSRGLALRSRLRGRPGRVHLPSAGRHAADHPHRGAAGAGEGPARLGEEERREAAYRGRMRRSRRRATTATAIPSRPSPIGMKSK